VVETPFVEKSLAMLRDLRERLPPEAHDLYGPVFGLSERHRPKGMPAERVADAVAHALLARRAKHRYLVGSDARIVSLFRRLPGRLRDRLIARHLPGYGDRRGGR
jgi:hypothetical protein